MATSQEREPTGVFSLLIDGNLEAGDTGFPVINPGTGVVFAHAPGASRVQLDKAVAAALRAQPAWAALTDEERRAHLVAFAQGIRERAPEIAEIFTREQGRPLAFAKKEIIGATHLIEAASRIEVKPEVIFEAGSVRRELHYRPLGVVAAITPWNVPVMMAAGKIVEGLQSGNAMVLKPSPYTPLATLMLGEVAATTLPAGILNILSGGNDLGAWMVEHPDVDMITFTGSTATGKQIGASASLHGLKRVILELGGNDAAIVLDDVDVASAAPKIFQAAFGNTGQICMAIKRLYVHESRFAELLDALVDLAENARVGEGFDPDVMLGPLQNKMQYDRVLELIEDARAKGAAFPAGGAPLARNGYFIPPTIVTGVTEGSRIVDEEQFGPVLPVMPYAHIEDALARANGTRFGLGGSIWTSDPERGYALARRLEVGTAWVNTHHELNIDAPFGGAKESGIGRVMSTLGAKTYMEPQVIDLKP